MWRGSGVFFIVKVRRSSLGNSNSIPPSNDVRCINPLRRVAGVLTISMGETPANEDKVGGKDGQRGEGERNHNSSRQSNTTIIWFIHGKKYQHDLRSSHARHDGP